MIKNSNGKLLGIALATLVLSYAGSLLADNEEYFENFPSMCSEASDRNPLPGHILRVGFVAATSEGWSFLFPEQRNDNMLERVRLIENAGVIGQPPDEDFSFDIRTRTGAGYFVVAQIFVGDPNSEPMVTCVSLPVPLARYQPTYYGPNLRWLDVDNFGRWLKFRRYGKWNWRHYWNFDRVRTKFTSFWSREGSRKFDKFKRYRKYRDRDNDRTRPRRDRDGDQPWKKIDDTKKRKDNTTKPVSKKPDMGSDSGKDGGWRVKPVKDDGFRMPSLSPKDGPTKPVSSSRKPDIVSDSGKNGGWRSKPIKDRGIKLPSLLPKNGPATSSKAKDAFKEKLIPKTTTAQMRKEFKKTEGQMVKKPKKAQRQRPDQP